MKLQIILLLMLIHISIYAQSDETFKNELQFKIGLNQHYIKDSNFSPLNQKGNGLLYSLSYQKQTKNLFKTEIQFSNGYLYSGPSDVFESIFYNANIQLEYLMRISAPENTFNTFLGLAYNTRVLYFDWYDQDSFSFIATHGISLKALFSKQFNSRHVLKTSFAIPILNFVSRPPYNGIDEYLIEHQDHPAKIIFRNQGLSSINNYFGVNCELSYVYAISARFNWEINYQLFYQFENRTSKFNGLSNIYATGLTYKF